MRAIVVRWLVLFSIVALGLTGCGGGGGSGGGSSSASLALHSGTLMFIGAQLAVYRSAVEWADVDGDGYLDLVSNFGDGLYGPEETYVAKGSLNEAVGRPELAFEGLTGAVADFNGDGLLDLVGALGTADDSSHSFAAVSLQNSDGTFGPPSNLGVPVFVDRNWDFAACDIDADGVADLLMNIRGSSPPGGTAVLLGRGDGTFVRLADVPQPAGVEVGMDFATDLNGDGFADIVTLDRYRFDDDALRVVRLGRGDGTFEAARFTSIEYNRQEDLFDFNGDGFPDFVSARRDGSGFIDQIWMYPGNATADYSTRVETPLPMALDAHVAWGVDDLNGDGFADALLVSLDSSGSSYALLGAGDGTFGAPVVLPANPWGPALDLNRDGHLDLLRGSGSLQRIMFGNGDGTFGYEPGPTVIATGDLSIPWYEADDADGDGNPDVIVRDFDADTRFILYGDGSGGFDSFTLPAATHGASRADLDGDGDLDFYRYDRAAGLLTIHRMYSQRDLRPLPPIDVGAGWMVEYTDVDGDGVGDFALQDNTGTYALFGLGGLRYEPVADLGIGFVLGNGFVGRFDDVNGDGRPDFVNYDYDLKGFNVRLQTMNRTFTAPAFTPRTESFQALFAIQPVPPFSDFNRDGRIDFLYPVLDGYATRVYVYLGSSDGTFAVNEVSMPAMRELVYPITGDFNGDGREDFFLLTFILTNSSDFVDVFLSDEAGGFTHTSFFQAHKHVGVFRGAEGLAADLTGDGLDDILMYSESGGISVSVSAGDGTFLGPYHFAIDVSEGVNLGDFDGDGDQDIVGISSSDEGLRYYENRYVD